MRENKIPLVWEGLAAYGVERQNGVERHQPEGTQPWAEKRRFWTDAILQGMARLEGAEPDPMWMERYDRRLEQARGSFAVEPASVELQRETIQALGGYLSGLEHAGGDRRQQVAVVSELMNDMASHLPWDSGAIGLYDVWDQAEHILVRMTAQAPIRFTRILLGWETGPCESVYVSGAVDTPEEVMDTGLYAELKRKHPEVTEWPALCVVYNGGGQDSPLGVRDANQFDLDIMNRTGDRFLDLPGIRWAGGPYELRLADGPSMTMNT